MYKHMGKQLGYIEVHQFYARFWHRLLLRKTYELTHKDKTYYFDSRSKVWSGTL